MHWVTAIVLLQAGIASLRSLSRANFLIRERQIAVMEVPLIEPPDVNATSVLWDITTGFRRSVHLALRYQEPDWCGSWNSEKVTSSFNLRAAHSEIGLNVSVAAYAPDRFASVRKQFKLSDEEYFRDLLLSGPFATFESSSKGAARVGGMFFFTRDGRYMIKTIKHDEVQTILRILPKYECFMSRFGSKSLLTKFCGLYEVSMPIGSAGRMETRVFLVTDSVFPAESSRILCERFDLKGSKIGRECSLAEFNSKGSMAVLKDMDLAREIELVTSLQGETSTSVRGHGFRVGGRTKTQLLLQLRHDVEFLAESNVIDYSLLVGVGVQGVREISSRDMLNLRKTLLNQRWANSLTVQEKASWYMLLSAATYPLRMFYSLARAEIGNFMLKAANVFVLSEPYYGWGDRGVDSGKFGVLHAERLGHQVVLYIGLIDFLQPFNWKKWLEWRVKATLHGTGFSCIPPRQYADRFLGFIDKVLS